MIEEIKKEIKNLTKYSEYMQNINGSHWNIETISIKSVMEILDKYKDKEDKYKNAWEELKEIQEENEKNAVNVGSCLELVQKLEQKHGIGVE